MKRHSFYVRYFKCPECGFRTAATKKKSRRTGVGHIKDMFCPICDKEVKFIQVE